MKSKCAALLLTLGLFQSQQTFCADGFDDKTLALGAAAGVMVLSAWGGYKLLGQDKKGSVETTSSSDSDAKLGLLESRIKVLEEGSDVSSLAKRLSDLEKDSTVWELKGALGKLELLVGNGKFSDEHRGQSLTVVLQTLHSNISLLEKNKKDNRLSISELDRLRTELLNAEGTIVEQANELSVVKAQLEKVVGSVKEHDEQIGSFAKALKESAESSEKAEESEGGLSDLVSQATDIDLDAAIAFSGDVGTNE
ncbi:MAG: hypothetical protein WD055_05585 [Candidatus Dependentiae bacterium]